MTTRITTPAELESVVRAAVSVTEVIDVHTHLFPPTHEPLMLWGIDELLCYHYLVAEFFITAPAAQQPDTFFGLPKVEQAALVWQALFVDRLPVSEAARGVVRSWGSMKNFGTWDHPRGSRRRTRRSTGAGFQARGARYAVMTNILSRRGSLPLAADRLYQRGSARRSVSVSGDDVLYSANLLCHSNYALRFFFAQTRSWKATGPRSSAP